MAVGAAVAAGVVMVGAYMQAQDQAEAYDEQADEYERNASATREMGKANVLRQKIVATKRIGAMSSDYAASGVASDSGSVLDTLAASHINAELDYLNITHGAEMRASAMEARANQAHKAGHNAITAGYFGMASAATSAYAKGGGKGTEDPEEITSKGGGGGRPQNYASSGRTGHFASPDYFGPNDEYV